jgi:hypothetical protein
VRHSSRLTSPQSRQHWLAAFCQRVEVIAPTALTAKNFRLEVTVCDFKLVNSSKLSWNMKSTGKRLTLRLIVCTKTLVSTVHSVAKQPMKKGSEISVSSEIFKPFEQIAGKNTARSATELIVISYRQAGPRCALVRLRIRASSAQQDRRRW